MRCMREETFGPLLPVMVVDTLDEAIRLANESEFGLTASGWTRSRRTARRLAEELHAGTVTINDHLFSFGEPTATWGGVKKSGVGRSHAAFGLHELVNVKHVSVDMGNAARDAVVVPVRLGVPRLHEEGVRDALLERSADEASRTRSASSGAAASSVT